MLTTPRVVLGLLLVAGISSADILGTVWENVPNPGNASDPANKGATLASAQFTSTGISYCSSGGYSDAPCFGTASDSAYTVGAFLNNPTFTGAVNGFSAANTLDNTEVELTGSIFLTAGANNFDITHDDGLTLSISGGIGLVVNKPGPTSPVTTPFTITAPSDGLYTFTLDYAECCGAPGVLMWTYPSGAPVGSVPEASSVALLGTATMLSGLLLRRRKRA